MPDVPHGEAEAKRPILRGLAIAVELSIVVLVVEAVGALASRSLSLTIDAIHNVPDLLAFAVSYTALRATAEGTSADYSFGTHRFEVFAGVLNAALVLGTGLVFGYESLVSLVRTQPFAGPVDAVWLLAAAIPVFALRSLTLAVLGRIPRRARDLNLRSVVLHLASDIAITAALVGAGIVLLLRPGYFGADAVAGLVIAALLVAESLPLFRDAGDVLTERIPRNLSSEEITRAALAVPGITELHDLHVWAVCPTLVCMTAHVRVREMSVRDASAVVDGLRERMESEFGIVHSVFQVEAAP